MGKSDLTLGNEPLRFRNVSEDVLASKKPPGGLEDACFEIPETGDLSLWPGTLPLAPDETWGAGGRNPDFEVLTAFNSVLPELVVLISTTNSRRTELNAVITKKVVARGRKLGFRPPAPHVSLMLLPKMPPLPLLQFHLRRPCLVFLRLCFSRPCLVRPT